MKKRTTIILLIVFVIGLALLLYPTFSDWWNSFHQSQAIATYNDQVANLDEDQYKAIWEAAWNYNQSLAERSNNFLLPNEQEQMYSQLLNLGGTGIMGYIDIPVLNQRIPIYHGTSDGVLQIAVGHLEWSSLPVGGESSHCVLSGHRGLPTAKLFTDLDQMVEGDIFMLRVLDEVLTYQVDQIRIVDPQDTSELTIVDGKDFCTLVTCTPYGVNTHRLLVRGRRIESPETAKNMRVTSDATRLEPIMVMPLLASPMLLFLFINLMIPKKKKKGGMLSVQETNDVDNNGHTRL